MSLRVGIGLGRHPVPLVPHNGVHQHTTAHRALLSNLSPMALSFILARLYEDSIKDTQDD
jgi:hypothetical protein